MTTFTKYLMTILAAGTLTVPGPAGAVASDHRGCDVDGDGAADLVAGVPREDVRQFRDAGALNVQVGEGQFLHQGTDGVRGRLEAGDHFGAALACGDFDDDGDDDLAVGSPREDVGDARNAGAVNVLNGSDGGVSVRGDRHLTQDWPAMHSTAESGDRFGSALAAGDFDGDGNDDLAIGVPGEGLDDQPGAGAVHVRYGSDDGLTGAGMTFLHQRLGVVDGTHEEADEFGAALAAGDFDGDGFDDLAVGVPGEGVDALGADDPLSSDGEGAVQVFFGSTDGIVTDGQQFLSQNTGTLSDDAAAFDGFGAALAAGDFDGDGFDDLAVGVPREDGVAGDRPGAVQALAGSATGLSTLADTFMPQTDFGGTDQDLERFGAALAAGDFDGDGFDDLAVGSPGENVGEAPAAGEVAMVPGSADGLDQGEAVQWHQDVTGVRGTAETGDRFGSALAAADLDGDDHDDLVVGVPREDVRDLRDAGALNVLRGWDRGLTVRGDRHLWQDSEGVRNASEPGDRFGSAVA